MITTTLEAQYADAVDKILAEGVHLALNVMTCCRSCTGHEDLGIAEGTTLYAYNFAGQGDELIWENGKPFFREEEAEEICNCENEEWDEDEEGNETLVSEAYTCSYCNGYETSERKLTAATSQYFYFGEVAAGEIISKSFKDHGFTVVWGSTSNTAVQIFF